MKNFGLVGVAGYIAPRHLKAIKQTGNDLKVALDPCDSVGILDSYFPDASFFTEIERFDRHIDRLRRTAHGLEYISICSPNYLHDSHIRLGLRNGCDVICEKPLVINPKNLEYLKILEEETGRRVSTILQLRLHPSIQELYHKVRSSPSNKIYDFDLTYITSRGKWYHHSWKADEEKSGGIATNIGIHFFDMLIWVFGYLRENILITKNNKTVSGVLRLRNANVRWFLSCDAADLPAQAVADGKRTYRVMKVDGKKIDFSSGFTDLHTKCYNEIIRGNSFGISDVSPSVTLAHELRYMTPQASSER